MTEPISPELLGFPEGSTRDLLENAWRELSENKSTVSLRQQSNEISGVAGKLLNTHLVLRKEMGGQFRVGNTLVQVTKEENADKTTLKVHKWNNSGEDALFTFINLPGSTGVADKLIVET